jgi:hypothetical protein
MSGWAQRDAEEKERAFYEEAKERAVIRCLNGHETLDTRMWGEPCRECEIERLKGERAEWAGKAGDARAETEQLRQDVARLDELWSACTVRALKAENALRLIRDDALSNVMDRTDHCRALAAEVLKD